MYYGPDTEAACNAALGLQLTRDLLADLDPVRTEQALERLRALFAARESADGVWLDSHAWLITAVRE